MCAGTGGEGLGGVVGEAAGVLGPEGLDEGGAISGEVVADVGLAGVGFGVGIGAEEMEEFGEGRGREGGLVVGFGEGVLGRPDGIDTGEIGGGDDLVVDESGGGGVDVGEGEGGKVAVDGGDGGDHFDGDGAGVGGVGLAGFGGEEA